MTFFYNIVRAVHLSWLNAKMMLLQKCLPWRTISGETLLTPPSLFEMEARGYEQLLSNLFREQRKRIASNAPEIPFYKEVAKAMNIGLDAKMMF